MADIIQMIDQRIRRAMGGLRAAFRGELTRITTDGGVQTTQLGGVAGEVLEGVELFQHYGLTSVPPAGSEVIILPLGGRSTHSIAIATEHGEYRLQGLSSGEVALYTDEGTCIVLRRGKIIDIECDTLNLNCKDFNVNASNKATFTTPELQTSELLTADGKLSANGGMSVKGGEDGKAATIEGTLSHSGGDIETDGDVVIGGVRHGTHKHDTPDGLSGGPKNG